MKIFKLRQMNEKLVKEMKILSAKLDKSMENVRSKAKSPEDIQADAHIKGIVSDFVILDSNNS